jgi:hypothetical protein
LRLKKRSRGEERRLTQAEILAEAQLTERSNLESLKRYEEMELEAKRRAVRSGKREIRGPVIRYHSLRSACGGNGRKKRRGEQLQFSVSRTTYLFRAGIHERQFLENLEILPNAIHKHVLSLDFSLAIDFSSPGSRPWISFPIESKIMRKPPTRMGKDYA